MLNYIWLGLILSAIVVGAINNRLSEVTAAAFEMAKTSVIDIAFPLIGAMALWLGILKIAEESGLVKSFAKLLKPITKRLFPDIPPDHPAITAIVLNLSANWLGLANAATPLGLKAMKDLQGLNENKDVASNAMVTFLALNTAAITFIPAKMLSVRLSLGSSHPEEIIGPTIFAGLCATTMAIIAAFLLRKIPIFNRDLPEETRASVPKEES